MTEHVVGKVGDFEDGNGYEIRIDGITIALFRTGDDFRAISNRCPHKNAPLHIASKPLAGIEGKIGRPRGILKCDEEECYVRCPWHSLKFDLDTGYNEVTKTGIPTFSVNVKGEDVVIEI